MLISGKLKSIAKNVDEEVGEMMERLEKEYFDKHRGDCVGFWETCQIREQGRMLTEEIVRNEIVYKVR